MLPGPNQSMALVDTYMQRLKPDLPYMTANEMGLFKKVTKDGGYSIFRQHGCKRCGAFIPKTKQFCSKECYDAEIG